MARLEPIREEKAVKWVVSGRTVGAPGAQGREGVKKVGGEKSSGCEKGIKRREGENGGDVEDVACPLVAVRCTTVSL